jgi:CMP-N-acetylneuraminic acid synthetase
MKILAIIPARGKSKGIPQKNLQIVAGHPLVAWSIKAAKNSTYINRIVVSTDDQSIAETSSYYGAEVVERPDEISGDEASSESALLHVLETLYDREQYRPDLTVFLQCTSPLTISEDIDSCIASLLKKNSDTAVTVTDFHYFLWRQTPDGNAEGINHNKNIRERRQDREPQYLETGAVYVMKTEGFLQNKHRFFGKTALSLMPPSRVLEIDHPSDLRIADERFRMTNSSG